MNEYVKNGINTQREYNEGHITEYNEDIESYLKRFTTNTTDTVDTTVDVKDTVEDNVEDKTQYESFIRKLMYDQRRYSTLCIRVTAATKYIWDSLLLDDKRLLRDSFERIIREYVKVTTKQRVDNRIVLNINIQQQIVTEQKEDSVLKLKREIDRLNKELSKTLEENMTLKKQIEELKKQLEASKQTQAHTQAYAQVQAQYESYLRESLYTLHLVRKCMTEVKCDQNKLLSLFIDKTIAQLSHVVQIRKEFIDVMLKNIVIQ